MLPWQPALTQERVPVNDSPSDVRAAPGAESKSARTQHEANKASKLTATNPRRMFLEIPARRAKATGRALNGNSSPILMRQSHGRECIIRFTPATICHPRITGYARKV